MKKQKNKFPFIRTLVVFLGSVTSFLLSSIFHSNGSLGSNILTMNELSRLSGTSSIPVNDIIRTVLEVSSRVLFCLGFIFAFLTLRHIFKFILSTKFVKNFLNNFFGGK